MITKNLDADKISWLAGSEDIVGQMPDTPAKVPFAEDVRRFLEDVSGQLMKDHRSRQYPDVVTFAFWIRRAAVERLKDRFMERDGNYHMGRGVVFHIAPSNVPVNFAYSLAAGLLTGNSNIVRVPGRDFEQTVIIAEAFSRMLEVHEPIKPYIALVRYGREQEINDWFSSIADVRIIWGGDQTVASLRKSPLPARSTELTFADRFSLAVIDSDVYLETADKKQLAENFYNDTYLSDQNACTSPKIVIWTGTHREEAKEKFWGELYSIVSSRYLFQDIQGINKLTSSYLSAAACEGVKILPHQDNRLIRIQVTSVDRRLTEFMDHSGFFFEYDCGNLLELYDLCNDKRCQTLAYIGDKAMLSPLIQSGIRGVDRIVPAGRTMDFDLLWDGYNLYAGLTRVVAQI